MHPLRLYMASPLFVTYAVSCITLTFVIAHVWHACILVVAVNWLWFVAMLWVDSLLHAVTNSVSSLRLGFMPVASSIVSVPLVGQLHQMGPGAATFWAPHTSSPFPPWPLHMFTQPHNSTSTLKCGICWRTTFHFTTNWKISTATFDHLPLPISTQGWGKFPPLFLGCIAFAHILPFWHMTPHPGIVGLLQADHLGGPAPRRNGLARVW